MRFVFFLRVSTSHTGNTTTARRAAVRGICVSRDHQEQMKGHLKLPEYHSNMLLRGLRVPSIDASLSNIWCKFFRLVSTSQTGNTKTVRRTAVRETCISQHHKGPMEGTLKHLEHHSYILLRVWRGPQLPWVSQTSAVRFSGWFQPARLQTLQRSDAQLSERFASLGIMKTQWRAPWNTSNITVTCYWGA